MADAFTLPPAGLLSEQIDLPDLLLSFGLIHREGEGIKVGAWDGELIRTVPPEAATRWARDIEASPYAEAHKAVSEALLSLVDRILQIETGAMLIRVRSRLGGPANVAELLAAVPV